MHRRRKSSHGGGVSNATKRKNSNSFVHQDIHIIDDLCSSYTGNNNMNSQESIMVMNNRLQESQASIQPSNYLQQYMEIQENHALQVAIQEVHEKEDQPERESAIRDQSTCQEGESALKSTSRLAGNNSKSKSTSVKKFKARQSVLSTIEGGGRSSSRNSRSSMRSNRESGGRSQRAAQEAAMEDSLQNPMIVNITGKSISVVQSLHNNSIQEANEQHEVADLASRHKREFSKKKGHVLSQSVLTAQKKDLVRTRKRASGSSSQPSSKAWR